MPEGLCMNWSMMRWLGYGGLIPFLGLAVGAWLVPTPELRLFLIQANASYGVSILSFLGAIHWGFLLGQHATEEIDCSCSTDQSSGALADTKRARFALVWGVTPALLAWAATLMLPVSLACQVMAACLWLAWIIDRNIYGSHIALKRFVNLRTHLTLGASIGLIITSLAR